VAVDVAQAAVDAARARLAGRPGVDVGRASLPEAWPEGTFDLVVASEVLYYFDRATLGNDLTAGGFTRKPSIETVMFRGRANTASDASIAFCQGTPLRGEIEARGSLEHATAAGAAEVARRFGAGPIDTKIQAHVVTVEK